MAALLAVLLDLPGKSASAALLLLAGAAALTLPLALLSLVGVVRERFFPGKGALSRGESAAPAASDERSGATSDNRSRAMLIVVGAALGGPALGLAVARLGPTFPAPAAWMLPALVGLVVVVALAPGLAVWRAGQLRSARRPWLTLAIASVLASALFLVVHVGEGTLSSVREGTGTLHVALFGGTLVITALVAGLVAVAADDGFAAALPGRGRALLAAVGLALGAACLFADRRALVDLYPHVHRWLTLVGLSSLAAGIALLAPARLRAGGALGRIATVGLVVTATLAVAVAGRGAKPALRAELNEAPVGKTLLGVLSPKRGKGGPVTTHPLLAVNQMLKEPGPPGKSNLLLITVDALRDDQLDAGLPALGRLSAESVRFHRAYTQGTRTAVAIGALMLGTYSAHIDWRQMIYRGGRLQDPAAMSEAQIKALKGKFVYTTVPAKDGPEMLAERLHAKGLYTMVTAYAGDNEFFQKGGSYDRGWDAFEDMTEQKWQAPTSAKVGEVAEKQRAGAGDKRWFQWIHFYDPHESNGTRPKYEIMVRAFDEALGHLIDDLKARGQWENTVVVLSADHGEALGEHGHKGHATSLYEEQARVPLLIRVPGVAARTLEQPVALIDVHATLAVAAGADTGGLDGVNLWPAIFSNQYPARRPVFLELHRYYSNSGARTTDLKGLVLDDHKLVVDRLKGTEQLFSLKDDPKESTNVLATAPERAAELHAVLDAFLSQAEAEHPLP